VKLEIFYSVLFYLACTDAWELCRKAKGWRTCDRVNLMPLRFKVLGKVSISKTSFYAWQGSKVKVTEGYAVLQYCNPQSSFLLINELCHRLSAWCELCQCSGLHKNPLSSSSDANANANAENLLYGAHFPVHRG
jgi:hypothetical protein